MNAVSSRGGNTALYRKIFGWLCLLTVLCPLLRVMLPEDAEVGIMALQLLTAGMLILLPATRRKLPVEAKLLAAWFVWNFVTRAAMGDLETGLSGSTLFSAAAYCIFCMGCVLEGSRRERMLNWLTGIFCGILLFWSLCGILIVLKGSSLPLIRENIFLMDEVQDGHHVRSLAFYNLHRNETAPWFMVGLWLMVYQWFACKNRKWRVPIALTGVVFYVIVALQHCRTVYLATAGGFAMLALLVLMPRSGERKNIRRWIIALMAAAVCLGVSYKGFSVCDQVVSRTAQITSRIYCQLRGLELPAAEEAFTDDRSLLQDMKTVTGRKSIWRAVYRTRIAYPGLLLAGQREEEIVPLLMEQGGLKYKVGHVHNMFLQALVETGLPGMALYLTFVVLLVIRMVKLFFRDWVPLARRCMTLISATLLVFGMVETLMSRVTWLSSLCLMLAAGLVTGWERESAAVPEKAAESAGEKAET